MGALIRKAVIQGILDFVAETRRTLAARVSSSVAALKTWLPGTIEPVTAAVRGGYTAVIAAITKWLDRPAGDGKPSTVDRLTLTADQLLTRAEKLAKDAKDKD